LRFTPENRITICALFFGDHPALCQRFLRNLFAHTPAECFELRAGLNAVCEESQLALQQAMRHHGNVSLIESPENIYKLPMMRRLFREPRILSEWIVWFDDDSFPARADWLQTLALFTEMAPEIAMWGSPRWMTPDPALLEFTRASPWFRGKEFLRDPETGQVGFHFLVGGYWAIRTEVVYKLDWPDARLAHFEDDYLLGEALRQNDCAIGHCESGVVIDCALRRCPPDAPWRNGAAMSQSDLAACSKKVAGS